MVTVMTVGIVRLEEPKPRTEYPSEAEIRRAAPRAWELSRLLTSECDRVSAQGVGVRCSFAFAVRTNAAPPPGVDVEVELLANAEASSTCRMKKTLHVAIDPPTDAFRPIP